METLIGYVFLAGSFVGAIMVILASTFRCRHCRRWHTSAMEEWLCEQEHVKHEP